MTFWLRLMLPDVPVIIMVYVPAGVPFGLLVGIEPPPQATIVPITTRRIPILESQVHRRERLERGPTMSASGRSNHANTIAEDCPAAAENRDVVVTVSVVVAALAPGLTDVGLNEHTAPCGTPELQENDTAAEKPGWPRTSIMNCADWPAVIALGLGDAPKSNGGTVSKVAVTFFAASMVTEQLAVPLHAPLQPSSVEPLAGVAVRLTTVPLGKEAEHVAPQSILAGLLVTVPLPVPARVTVSGLVVTLPVRMTLCGLPEAL